MSFLRSYVTSAISLGLALSACGGDPPPPPNTAANTAPSPAPPATVPSAPAPQPGAPGPAMAAPGAFATPCQSDAQCGTHKCNGTYGKCAFPCQTQADCNGGAACLWAGNPVATCALTAGPAQPTTSAPPEIPPNVVNPNAKTPCEAVGGTCTALTPSVCQGGKPLFVSCAPGLLICCGKT